MYLLDGDSESAVASWQATFSSTSDRTLVVGAKNTDLGVASASRPLGLKVVGAMDRLAIALNNVAHEAARHDVSAPRAGGTLPTASTADGTGTAAAQARTRACRAPHRHDLAAARAVGQHESRCRRCPSAASTLSTSRRGQRTPPRTPRHDAAPR